MALSKSCATSKNCHYSCQVTQFMPVYATSIETMTRQTRVIKYVLPTSMAQSQIDQNKDFQKFKYSVIKTKINPNSQKISSFKEMTPPEVNQFVFIFITLPSLT